MTPFRDPTSALSTAVAALAAQRRAEAATIPRGWRSIYVQRTARIAAGIAGTVAAAAIAVAMERETGGYLAMIGGAWLAAVVAYVVALVIAAAMLDARIASAVKPTGEPHHDLAMLRAVSPRRLALELSRRRGNASHGWPLVAAVLLGPHTLQGSLIAVLGVSGTGSDEYILFTAAWSAHLFAYGVWAAWRYPVTRSVWTPVAIIGVMSLVPGVLTLGLSSAIALVTAAIIAVVVFWPMTVLVDGEWARIAAEAALLDDELTPA